MSYSRWSNSVWYTYHSCTYSEDCEVLAIHHMKDQHSTVVWSGEGPNDVTVADILESRDVQQFDGATEEEKQELSEIIYSFFMDCYEDNTEQENTI